jgi:hypothetical protein
MISVEEEEEEKHRNHIRRLNGGHGCIRLLEEHGSPVGMTASGSRGMLGLKNLLLTSGASGGGGAPMPSREQLLTSTESHKRLLRLPHTRDSDMGFDQLF